MAAEKKRGRKPKDSTETIQDQFESHSFNADTHEQKVQKKRGRKPKGGKIVESPFPDGDDGLMLPNIIAHFKCNITDVENMLKDGFDYSEANWQASSVDNFQGTAANDLGYTYLSGADLREDDKIRNDNYKNSKEVLKISDHDNDMTEVYRKLKELEIQFHNNDCNGKRSACFWDTCPFDTPAFYIPKLIDSDSMVKPYGSFCCLECALAYLESEEIDSSCKFERRQLLFHMYRGIINNRLSVKPAPDPRYTLDKFFGNLTIQEWRKLLKSDRMLLVVDKPLTPELPELHVESADRLIAPGTMSGSEIAQYGKFKIRKNAPPPAKGAIVAQRFGKT